MRKLILIIILQIAFVSCGHNHTYKKPVIEEVPTYGELEDSIYYLNTMLEEEYVSYEVIDRIKKDAEDLDIYNTEEVEEFIENILYDSYIY